MDKGTVKLAGLGAYRPEKYSAQLLSLNRKLSRNLIL